jgi:hypothetical protein
VRHFTIERALARVRFGELFTGACDQIDLVEARVAGLRA